MRTCSGFHCKVLSMVPSCSGFTVKCCHWCRVVQVFSHYCEVLSLVPSCFGFQSL